MQKRSCTLKNQERSHNIVGLSYALLFLFMLACNILTPYLADDFTYMFSFQSGERIKNLLDIFPSMLAHAQKMNGRLVTHFLVQLTFLFPANLFDFCQCGDVYLSGAPDLPHCTGKGSAASGFGRGCVLCPMALRTGIWASESLAGWIRKLPVEFGVWVALSSTFCFGIPLRPSTPKGRISVSAGFFGRRLLRDSFCGSHFYGCCPAPAGYDRPSKAVEPIPRWPDYHSIHRVCDNLPGTRPVEQQGL